MNKKMMALRIISFLFTVAFSLSAFLFSSDNAEISAQKSKAVTDMLAPLLITDYEKKTEEGKQAQKQVLEGTLRKTAHALEYMAIGGCSALCALTFTNEKKKSRRSALLLLFALLYSAVYAFFDEFHQRFVSGRAGSFEDVLLDFFASACAALIVWGVAKAYYQRKRSKELRRVGRIKNEQ